MSESDSSNRLWFVNTVVISMSTAALTAALVWFPGRQGAEKIEALEIRVELRMNRMETRLDTLLFPPDSQHRPCVELLQQKITTNRLSEMPSVQFSPDEIHVLGRCVGVLYDPIDPWDRR